MRPRASTIACRALLLALTFSAVLPAHAGTTAEEAALREQVDALRNIVVQLQAQVNRLATIAAGPAPAAVQPPASSSTVPPVPAAAQSPVTPTVAPVAAPVPVLQAGQVSPEAALKDRWSQVRPSLRQDDVTRLLGTPSSKFTIDGRHVWYYVYPGIGRGSVFFTDAGRVSSLHSPFGFGG